MKLERFKEKDNKRIGIIVFTIICIMLVSGVILYRTFAIFEVKTNQNVINGNVQSMGDLEFAFYKEVDGKDTIVKEVPTKNEGYSLDTSSSYCVDLLNDKQVSTVNWDYENWEVRVKNISTTKTKCYLHFKQIYVEKELNGAIPDLGNGRLVPVQIKEEQPAGITIQNIGDGSYGGKVVKADITQEWYKYGDQRWANAVILKDGVSDDYASGDEILESDIESYFVWIPRYRYQLKNNEEEFNKFQTTTNIGTQADINAFYDAIKGNKGTTEAFNIQFESKDKGYTQGSKQGDYITHPAFLSFDSNGFWVGKFETGYDGAKSKTDAQNLDVTNQVDVLKIVIKPNVYSWRDIQVANAFYTSYDYQRDLESHMMKNMEWGAVAYLTQSKYGRCREIDGDTSCEEVRINNSSNYVTGSSAVKDPITGFEAFTDSDSNELNQDTSKVYNYHNSNSVASSTTNNYYGIYDMAGGSSEYVMGVMQSGENDTTPASGRNELYNSGFNGNFSCSSCDQKELASLTNGQAWPSLKYYDKYDYKTSNKQYQRGHLGDGTKEFGPFYEVAYQKISDGVSSVRSVSSYNMDVAGFVFHGSPWFLRGSSQSNGAGAGIFGFMDAWGNARTDASFRIVLSP